MEIRGDTAARAREYGFLLCAGALAAACAVVHDQITVTLSPEYFIYGKGLEASSLRWHVTWLAVRAGLPVGLLGGAALLVANNPRPSWPPPLRYRALAGLALLPPVVAALVAGVSGVINARDGCVRTGSTRCRRHRGSRSRRWWSTATRTRSCPSRWASSSPGPSRGRA